MIRRSETAAETPVARPADPPVDPTREADPAPGNEVRPVASSSAPISLSQLPSGGRGTLSGGRLADEDRRLLAAMGLTDRSPVRVCRQGEPCIVEVHTTRVGLARTIAERLHVTPLAGAL